MVVLGTTIHEFACCRLALRADTRGWPDQVRPWPTTVMLMRLRR